MNTYTLSAALQGKRIRRHIITAHDDASAMMEAIPYIMDKAYNDKLGPWALGFIALRDESNITVNSMEAKS
jgi:hypothetical protein